MTDLLLWQFVYLPLILALRFMVAIGLLVVRGCRVKQALSALIGNASFFSGFERSKAPAFPADRDLRQELSPSGRYATYAKHIVRAGTDNVLRVFGRADQSQIGEAVIQLHAVNVINGRCWPFTGHVKPRQPMGGMSYREDLDSQVAGSLVDDAGRLATQTASPIIQPRKEAGFWIVVEKFAQALRSKIGRSHDALQLLIGQRPGSVSALAGLRYFSAAQRAWGAQ